jgi:hypothetical protein
MTKTVNIRDKRLSSGVVGLLLTFLSITAVAADEAGIKIVVNRQEVFLGENFLMEVQVSGATDAPEPDLKSITNASIRLVGNQAQNRTFMSVINGRVQTERFVGRIYYYEITPAASGIFKAGPISAVVNGKRVSHQGTQVTVHGVEEQDTVRLAVEASRTAVLVDEPFTITLVIAIQALKGQFGQYEPLDPRNPPHLDAAYLESNPMQGLVMPDIQKALQSALVAGNAPGFTLNQYTRQRDMFSMPFFDTGDPFREAARFGFQHRSVTTNNRAYHEYRFPLSYTPKVEGTYTFGPVTFKGNALVSVATSQGPLTRQYFAVGPAVVVRVVPPPEEGRPATFIGAVGSNLTVDATLDAQTCNIGDPLTLTLTVTGNANLENVSPLDLASVPEVSRGFRVIEGVQTQTRDRERRFLYTLRPTAAGTIELPSIPVSYYDVASRAYRTVHTQPLPVRVNETAVLSQTRVLISSDNGANAGLAGAQAVLAVAPFEVHPAGAHPGLPWFPKWVLITIILAPLVFCASLATRPATAALRRLRTLGRRAAALARAASEIRAAASVEDERASAALVGRSVRRYCAIRFNIPAADNMTPAEIEDALVQRGIDPEPAAKLAALLERGASVMFGGTTPSERKGVAWREQVTGVLESIDRRRL